ncbi:MAG: heme biosynthesis protein HemY [Alphaproteobacteria bacterium]|nr:heme biosynthesis protein HemY [Alphaproteobacteria bacterium]
MIRALWTLAKISIVVAIVLWVAERPGTIIIDWMQYKLTFHVGFFILSLMTVVVLGIFIFSTIKYVLDLPKNIQRYNDIKDKDKGLKALTLGICAVASGDKKSANYQSIRANRFLGEEEPLSLLLSAQAARLDGREHDAATKFAHLISQKEVSFLGLKGLLQSALDAGDYEGAREIGHEALKQNPTQDWLLQVVYGLEVRLRNWDSAVKVLYTAEKNGAISVNKANSDRVAMILAQADEAGRSGNETNLFRLLQKAYKVDPRFIPTVTRLAGMYLDRGKRKAALSIIEEVWKITPHPDLVTLWGMAVPAGKEGDEAMARMRWFEKLLELNPKSVEGLQAAARASMEAGLWGEARRHLEQAESIRPNVNLYKLWAKLEDRTTQNDEAVREWLSKAADAPSERVWICSETGRIYGQWSPISDRGLFNTIIWDFPQGKTVISNDFVPKPSADSLLLESKNKRA